jgi:pimeloyl-ACP methyl ester carboxylesterase
VREALGHERINLIGASYGTRAALEYLRLHPERVRRIVLDGVAPADMSLPQSFAVDAQAALERLFADCAADAQCAQRHPRLRQHWDELFADLPKPVSVNHPLTGARESFEITHSMVAALGRTPLYAPSLAAALPQAIDEAAAGRWAPLVGLASVVAGRSGEGVAMAMHFSVICAEDFPPRASTDSATAGQFAHTFEAPYGAVCGQWPKGEVSADFYRIPASTVPNLLFSGGSDPATAPRHAERVAQALGDKARHVVVANAGHGIMAIGCASNLIFRFIDSPEDNEALKIDTACLGDIPRPSFFVPLGARMGGGS